MTARHTRTDVPHTAREMYDLVADVERYPDFLPWCVALRVISTRKENGGDLMLADMVVGYRMFRETFRSKVRLDPAHLTIDVDYVEGPFRSLTNAWRFEDRPEGGSTVDFKIAFEFKNRILQATAHGMFEKVFLKMSEAFVERANEAYGGRRKKYYSAASRAAEN